MRLLPSHTKLIFFPKVYVMCPYLGLAGRVWPARLLSINVLIDMYIHVCLCVQSSLLSYMVVFFLHHSILCMYFRSA